MRKKIVIGIFLMLVLGSFTMIPNAGADDRTLTTELLAGQFTNVGEVQIFNIGDTLNIQYLINDPNWVIVSTHTHVASSKLGIPHTKKGNPIPGQFMDIQTFDPPVTEYLYTLTWTDDAPCYVAAHAMVEPIIGYEGDIAGFEAGLPDQVIFTVTYPYGGGPAYFPDTTINGLDTTPIHVYGWCIDTDHVIYQNTWYTANIYSSTETIPIGLIEHPENLDIVNWILNQHYFGQTSPGGYGTYTYSDIQYAIWHFVEDVEGGTGLYDLDINRANEIIAAATLAGDGFIPECGDIIAVVLTPVDTAQVIIAQVILGEVVVPCIPIYGNQETAWGKGTRFVKTEWAMYIIYGDVTNEKPMQSFWERLFEQFPQAFPILRHLMGF